MRMSQKALGRTCRQVSSCQFKSKAVYSPEPVEDDEIDDNVDDADNDVDAAHDEGGDEEDPLLILHVLEGVHHQQVDHQGRRRPRGSR